MVGIIAKFPATQVAGFVALDDDADTRIIYHGPSGDWLCLFRKTHPLSRDSEGPLSSAGKFLTSSANCDM